MTIKIEGSTATVDTVGEALTIADMPGLEHVVITDSVERIRMTKIIRNFSMTGHTNPKPRPVADRPQA